MTTHIAGIPLEEWKALYRQLDRFAHLAPWQWMEEAQIFGVQDPETGTVHYISIVGGEDELPVLLLFSGDEGWHTYWTLMEFAVEAGTIPDEVAFTMPMLIATWGEEDSLLPAERELIRELNITPTPWGWPVVRDFRPGWAPWYPDREGVRLLTLALKEGLHVAEHLRDMDTDTLLKHLEQGEVLVRVPRQQDDGIHWENVWYPMPEEEEQPYRIRIPADALDQLRHMLPNLSEVQVDFFMLPTGVQEEEDERPYIPFLLLVVDGESGEPLVVDLLRVQESIRHMYEHLPGRIVQELVKAQVRPARFRVRSERLRALLEPVAQELNAELVKSSSLRALDRIRIHLLEKIVGAGEGMPQGMFSVQPTNQSNPEQN